MGIAGNNVTYPQYSADGLPVTYVPNPFAADGKPVDSQWKDPVRTHTTGDIALSGLQTLDGVSVMEGDRVLVKDQVIPQENGIYVASAGQWRRAPDMYLWPQFVAAVVAVQEGNSVADTVWVTDVPVDGTVDVTPVYWISVQAATGTLPTFTSLRALVTDVAGEPSASPTTAQEIAFVHGVTSSIQKQFAALGNQAASAFTIAVTGTNAADAAQGTANSGLSTAQSAYSIAVLGTNAAATSQSTANSAYALAQAGTDIGSLAYTVATSIGEKYVRTTRFASIGAGTSGAVALPPNATVVIDDFGGGVDAVVTTISAGRPTFSHAFTSTGAAVTTTFDAAGNYSFSGTPSAYPVGLVYRVRQKLSEFDSTATDIIGSFDVEDNVPFVVLPVTAGTTFVPIVPTEQIYMVDTSGGDAILALPNSTGWQGHMIHVKKITADGNYVHLRSATGTATVDNVLDQVFKAPLMSLQVTAYANNWYIL